MGKRDEVILLSVIAISICLFCSISTLSMTWDRHSSNCQEFCLLQMILTPLVVGAIGAGFGLIIVIRNRKSVLFSRRPWLLSLAIISCVLIGVIFTITSYVIIVIPYEHMYDFFDAHIF